jgi:AraC-like DNA-binding protein
MLEAILIIISTAACFAADAPLPLWQEDFEYGRTFTRSAVAANAGTIDLVPSSGLQEWTDSGGTGLLENGYDPRKDYFQYKRREGNRLLGVSGIDYAHPEGVEAQCNGLGRWYNPRGIAPAANDSLSAVFDGFGYSKLIRKGVKKLVRRIEKTDSVYLRFYMIVDSLPGPAGRENDEIIIHTLMPGNLVRVLLKPYSGDSTAIIFSVQKELGRDERIVHVQPKKVPACLEYCITVDQRARRFRVSLWVNGNPVGPLDHPLIENTGECYFYSLLFGELFFSSPLVSRFRLDNIVYAKRRIGPLSEPAALSISRAPNGWIKILPAGKDVRAVRLELGHDNCWRFPFVRETAFFPALFINFRFFPFPREKLVYRCRIKRAEHDWGLWAPAAPFKIAGGDSVGRTGVPVVDSILILERGTENRALSMVPGKRYDLLFFASDLEGFDNLYFNYIMFHHETLNRINPTRQNTPFLPEKSYALSMSREEAGNVVYAFDQPGTNLSNTVCPDCTTLVDCRTDCFAINKKMGYWKTNIRLQPEALPGLWLLEGIVFNKQEKSSLLYGKKINVSRAVPKDRAVNVWICIVIAALTILILAWGARRLKRGKTVLRREIKDERILRAVKYITENYANDLKLEDVAAAVNISPNWLSSRFKVETGLNLSDYLNRTRIENSLILLKEGKLTVSEICFQVGFKSQSYFNNVFKKYTGKSPGNYKK